MIKDIPYLDDVQLVSCICVKFNSYEARGYKYVYKRFFYKPINLKQVILQLKLHSAKEIFKINLRKCHKKISASKKDIRQCGTMSILAIKSL